MENQANNVEATTRIKAVTTVADAGRLAADWYGMAENSESDDIREVCIAAWINAADMKDDGASEAKAFAAFAAVINNQFPNTI